MIKINILLVTLVAIAVVFAGILTINLRNKIDFANPADFIDDGTACVPTTKSK